MKYLILFALSCYLSLNIYSQSSNEYMDLLVLYVDEEFEKCLHKCEKYMEKEETKKDPLPYLYASMSFYEMSRDNKYAEDYPKAYFDALSYAIKYRKKDKGYLYKKESETYLEKLKMVIAEDIDNYKLDASERGDKKIVSLLKKVTRLDPNDTGTALLMGLYNIKTKNASEGKKQVKEALLNIQKLAKNLPTAELTLSQQYYFKESLIEYYTMYSEKNPDPAEKILLLGQDFFLEDDLGCELEDVSDYEKAVREVIN